MRKPMACRPVPAGVLAFDAAAQRLGVASRTLERRLRADPTYPKPVRFGNSRYFYESDIDALLAGPDEGHGEPPTLTEILSHA